MQKIYERE
jgi:hypothetical protein